MMYSQLPAKMSPLFKCLSARNISVAVLHGLVLGSILGLGIQRSESLAMGMALGGAGHQTRESGVVALEAAKSVPRNHYLHSYSRIIGTFSITEGGRFDFDSSIAVNRNEGSTKTHADFSVESRLLPNGTTRDVINTRPMFEFAGVGFPHIETSRRSESEKYKPYKALVRKVSSAEGKTTYIPNVACHGYSPAKTVRKANRYDQAIKKWSAHYKVSEHLVKAVIAQESCFRNHAVSPVGARGLMQLMPDTAEWLGVTDQSNANQNLRAGIKYLAQLQKEFVDLDLTLAAYNAGPGNVRKHGAVPPYRETVNYVKKVKHFNRCYIAAHKMSL